MGVLNVTPDSFSDGGQFENVDAAISHGAMLFEQGAGLIDVGGESTRPGAGSVEPEEEGDRVLPVIAALASRGVPTSVDTTRAIVARAALQAGAGVVNDVSALRDPDMAPAVAETGAGLVLMHMQGEPRTMQEQPRYGDVVAEVTRFLVERAAIAEKEGIRRDRIAIDPGIGFGKTFEHNLELLRNLHFLVETGYPVVIGTSRKTFLGRILGENVPPAKRDAATGATVALAIEQGVAAVRVHNVAMAAQIARTTEAILGRGR
ncbi:MAG: dihydropteroate synthase [Acidimicrobiia bacterium]